MGLDPYGNPLPPGHGEEHDEWTSEPLPVCPECGALMRRRDGELSCDRHGLVRPLWIRKEEEDDE